MDSFNLHMKCIDKINELVSSGFIVEFGSGEGTSELLKQHLVLSIEDNEEYVIKRGDNHEIIHFQLKDGWYDYPERLTNIINEADLILVDGPVGKNRVGILNHMNLFKNYNGIIIFDDVHRELDMKTMVTFCNNIDYSFEIVKLENKWFAICTKNLNTPLPVKSDSESQKLGLFPEEHLNVGQEEEVNGI